MTPLRKLPLGISSFKAIQEDGYLYVDKTETIFTLMNKTSYNFLSRPRRFGKSLLLSTFKEIFLGNKELFNKLWIGMHSNYNWPVHPVIYIDMNEIDKESAEALEDSLRRLMDRFAFEQNIELKFTKSSGEKLAALVRGLAPRGKVVILIDEYDQPITRMFPDMEAAAKSKAVLKDFYGTIKSLTEYVQFLFITGVSKFSKTSLFSDLNNLNDLSLEPRAATIVGYTKQEIEDTLHGYVKAFSEKKAIGVNQIYDEMREWYNGYRFSSDEATVYNPWSIFKYLELQRRSNYWFLSGTPTFLIEVLKQENSYSFSDLEKMSASEELLNTFDINTIPLVALLYQTGYLTIKSYTEATNSYELTYPNKEVEISLASHLLGAFLTTRVADVEQNATGLRNALFDLNIERFTYYLQSLFAGIPYSMHKQQESYYHSLLHVVFTLLGRDVSSEVMTSRGRIDMVVELPETIFILELKLDKKPQEALDQIKEMHYAEKYISKNKPIMLVGMNFKYATKTITAVSELVARAS